MSKKRTWLSFCGVYFSSKNISVHVSYAPFNPDCYLAVWISLDGIHIQPANLLRFQPYLVDNVNDIDNTIITSVLDSKKKRVYEMYVNLFLSGLCEYQVKPICMA